MYLTTKLQYKVVSVFLLHNLWLTYGPWTHPWEGRSVRVGRWVPLGVLSRGGSHPVVEPDPSFRPSRSPHSVTIIDVEGLSYDYRKSTTYWFYIRPENRWLFRSWCLVNVGVEGQTFRTVSPMLSWDLVSKVKVVGRSWNIFSVKEKFESSI